MPRLIDVTRFARALQGLALASVLIATAAIAAPPSGDPVPTDSAAGAGSGWIFLDAPLWDLSDDGLPVVLTLGLPTRLDPLSRLLRGEANRWMIGLAYAKAYNRFDPLTDEIAYPGGHALMVSAGRQVQWAPPEALAPWAPRITLEVGINYASRPFKANSTRANFKLVPGLEWSWTSPPGHAWIAGLRWLHLSNANLLPRNAGYDGLTLHFGRSVSF